MAITTVLAFWTDQQTKAALALADARAAQTAAQAALNSRRTELAAANQQLADLIARTAKIRADLNAAETQADVEALGLELAAAIHDTRAAQSGIVEAEAAIDAAQVDVTASAARVSAASARATESAAAVKAAGDQDRDRAARLASLAKPPLATIVADATAAFTNKPWPDAEARIAADIPAKLRDCANIRAQVEAAGVANGRRRVSETLTLQAAPLDSVEGRRQVFEAADAAFRDHVVNAKANFDKAMASAARIADPKQNPLTSAESASIKSQKADGTVDAALQTKRELAADTRKAVATAQIDVDAGQTDLDIERIKVQAADVDLANPDTAATVKTALTALKKTTKTRDDAANLFTADMKADLANWETAVPDATWRNLADFDTAKALLEELTTDPAPLVAAMTTAEANLVASLIAADKADRTVAFLERETAQADAHARSDAASLARRELGALRGDS